MPILGTANRRGADKSVGAEKSVFETISDTRIDDSENIIWRNIGSQLRDIDLSPQKRENAIEAMEAQFFSSLLAKRMLTWWVDFIVGRGFYLSSSDPDANEVLKGFWNSPVNDMQINSRAYVKELCFYGELALPVKVNPVTGFCGISIIPSSQISNLIEKPGFPGEVTKLVTKADEVFDIVQWDSSKGEYEGNCFVHRVNRLAGHIRGYPDLIPLLDWTHIFESFGYNKLERDATQYGVWWDVTLDGKTEEEIEAYVLKQGGASPKAGSAIYHNERVNWTMMQQKPFYAASRDAEFFLNLIMGSSGLINLGGENNGSSELLDPAINSMNSRQMDTHSFFSNIGKFVIQEAIKSGRLEDKEYSINVVSQRIGVRDIQRSSGALLRITNSLKEAAEKGWIEDKFASDVFVGLLYRLDLTDAPNDLVKTSGENVV